MKILYDHQIFSWQDRGGISRYFIELQLELKKINQLRIINSTLISNNIYLGKISTQIWKFLPGVYIPGKTQLIKFIDKIISIYSLKIKKYDIFHPTYYDNYFFNLVIKKPFVVTVYDMIHELFPADFPNDTTSFQKKKALQKAAHIITISESTKKDLISILGLKANNITVIYLASSLSTLQTKRIGLPFTYLIYVGSRDKYKNFKIILQISSTLFKMYPDLKILCVGGGKFSSLEKQSMGKHLNNFIQLNLQDTELVYAYKHASCLLVPSIYEGFGLPVLEAMQCGCPVICSDSSSLPEVGGEAVLYFNPTIPEEMLGQINLILANSDLRSRLKRLGLQRAKNFSWEKTAKETMKVYRNINEP